MAKNEAKVTIGADTSNFNEAIKKANSTMTELRSEMKLVDAQMANTGVSVEGLEQKQNILERQQEQLRAKTRALIGKYDEAVAKWGEGSIQAQKMATQLNNARTAEVKMEGAINKCNAELQEARNKMDGAERSARDLADGLDAAGREARDLGGSVGEIAAGNIIADFAGNAISSLSGLEESTRQYRNEQNKLEAIAQTSGQSLDTLKGQYSDLYAITADETLASTATANLSAMGLSAEQTSDVVHAATGIWAKYGDSIPLDGLMESINESSRAAQVTGNLADALNWAEFENETFGVSMKENIEFTKLSKKEYDKLSDSQKAQYDAQKEQYDAINDWNKSVEEAVSAEDRFNLALQQCATEEERQQLIVDTLKGQYGDLADSYIENNQAVMDANRANEEMMDSQSKLAEKIAPIQTMVTSLAADGIGFLAENLEIIAPIAIAAGVSFGILAVALNFGAIVQGLSTAMGVLNAVMALNPAVLVVAGLVLLVTAFVTLWNNCSEFRQFWIDLWDGLCGTAEKGKEFFKSVIDTIKGFFDFEFTWPTLKLPHITYDLITVPVLGEIPDPRTLSVQWFAKGGIMTQPTLFGGGEAGPEAVLPIDRLQGFIDTAFQRNGGVTEVHNHYTIEKLDCTGDARIESAVDVIFERRFRKGRMF